MANTEEKHVWLNLGKLNYIYLKTGMGVTTDFFDKEQVEHLVATGRVTVITDFEEEGVTMLFPRGSYYIADARYRESYMTYLRRGLELERFVKSMHEKFEGLFTEFTGTSYRYTENGIIEE
tara:strand:+ start:290 stop:652 length:363 start_codon:yes stop_codon:yes gene_type:complete